MFSTLLHSLLLVPNPAFNLSVGYFFLWQDFLSFLSVKTHADMFFWICFSVYFLYLDIFFCDKIFVFFSVKTHADIQAKLDQWWLITVGGKDKKQKRVKFGEIFNIDFCRENVCVFLRTQMFARSPFLVKYNFNMKENLQ